MRILVTFVGGLGHLAPLLPLARAARAAGHDVAIAGSGGLVPRIEEAGFRALADDTMLRRCRAVAAEMHALPDVDAAVAVVVGAAAP